jgi:hypothetical protein
MLSRSAAAVLKQEVVVLQRGQMEVLPRSVRPGLLARVAT